MESDGILYETVTEKFDTTGRYRTLVLNVKANPLSMVSHPTRPPLNVSDLQVFQNLNL